VIITPSTATTGLATRTGSLTLDTGEIENLPPFVQELVFDFFSGPNATGSNIYSAAAVFTASVNLFNVPTEVSSVLVTGYNHSGEPVFSRVYPTPVVEGGTRPVAVSSEGFAGDQ
jgi:hypothetical protein